MKRILSYTLLTLLFIYLTECTSDIQNEPGVSLELAQFRKEVLSDINYQLSFSIPESKSESISGEITISFALSDNKYDLPLDFRESHEKLFSMKINGIDSDIIFEKEHIILSKEFLNTGANNVTIIFEAGETSLNRNDEYLYTLFVPDRARTAFPLFDQPNLKATYTLTLETPITWNTISNAPLSKKTSSDNSIIWEFSESDLISSYLFSFVAGKFEVIARNVDGREMTLLHRETDSEKVERNLDEIFKLHSASISWLEDYTGIDYPFKKFDFALIPSFQYGGMEHVGAIQYRASSLFLDEAPSETQLLSRASLIAHETAHMWFGDLVTMEWFNDVWTKEVFANFMASKIVNPRFPDINHDLNFLVRHYPSAYSVDRTEGANPIRQELPNLNEAGTMYGAIIYNKAPIMMRQLELLIGKDVFQEGLQEYLSTFSFGNATWPDLINILDLKTSTDLKTWSEIWVNTPGRPHFEIEVSDFSTNILQIDPLNEDRLWSQAFDISYSEVDGKELLSTNIMSDQASTPLRSMENWKHTFFNANGFGYGLFHQDLNSLEEWSNLDVVTKGSTLINLYENLLEGDINSNQYFEQLTNIISEEENQLILNLALGHFRSIYWDFFDQQERLEKSPDLEQMLWDTMVSQNESSRKKTFFNSYESIALSKDGIEKLYSIWNKSLKIDGLILSESDFIGLAGTLAIKWPEQANKIVNEQIPQIKNLDRKRRFEFIKPALSNDQTTRDNFFESLAFEQNRQTESWVLGALGYLHHPLRTKESEKYILPSLELLIEIQKTGDIFFPGRWMNVTLSNHHSDYSLEVVNNFLNERPEYNYQLKLKILQATDMMKRMNRIKKS